METWLAMQIVNGLILISFGLLLCARTKLELSRKGQSTNAGDTVRMSKEKLLADLRSQVRRLESELRVPSTTSTSSN
jgi:hypothetical protein